MEPWKTLSHRHSADESIHDSIALMHYDGDLVSVADHCEAQGTARTHYPVAMPAEHQAWLPLIMIF